jgi:hypothetical protein
MPIVVETTTTPDFILWAKNGFDVSNLKNK